jgi:hypothetical protein
MAGETIAKGVAIAAGNGAGPEVFTIIPGVTGIPSFASLDIPKVVVTALDSAGEEVIPGIGSAGDLSFTMNLRKATPTSAVYLPSQTILLGWLGDGLLHNFQLTYPGTVTSKVTFAAFVAKYRENGSSPAVGLSVAVTLTISGVPVRS